MAALPKSQVDITIGLVGKLLLASKFVAEIKVAGAQNLKRIHAFKDTATPGRILAFMESKTVWHPIGV